MLAVYTETEFQKYSGGAAVECQTIETASHFSCETRTQKWGTRSKWLLADAEFAYDAFVALGIVFLEVVEQATALADQHEKAAA